MIALPDRLEQILGTRPCRLTPLSGGCIGQVFTAELPDQRRVVLKVDDGSQPQLDLEGYMLNYLAEHSHLPVPKVIHRAPDLLVMSHEAGESRFSATAEQHAADLLADLHNINQPQFGLERDTLIGGLPQPNTLNPSWLDFFAEQRLLAMGRQALDAGRLPPEAFGRLEKLAGRLSNWLSEPAQPSLIHGDVWTTNVLAQHGRVTAFLDPAIYYADPEIELAFITLFNTFGQPFFQRYQEHRPLPTGFFEARRDLYNLYPLLVHVRLFGGSYLRSVTQILTRFGV